jgi:hypothetical protein
MTKRGLITICFSALAVTAVLAQDVNYVDYVHDNVTGQDSRSDVVAKEVTQVAADPQLVANSVPATMMVRTAALLELHAMRKSAVDLCIQLPTRYRTHLPECADIFKHEIRLQALAKDRK